MRRSLAVVMSITAFASSLALGWSSATHDGEREPLTSSEGERTPATPSRTRPGSAPSPTRDLFVFGDDSAPEAALEPALSTAPPPATADGAQTEATPEPRARLVGFVWQGRQLAAVLALDGVIEVAAVHEVRHGYRVLAIDEDAWAVSVVTPEGETLEVGPPDRP